MSGAATSAGRFAVLLHAATKRRANARKRRIRSSVSIMRAALLALLLTLPVLGAPLRVHVTVALCDNATQGIVPVPPAIGDGNTPRTNLYWGAMYGLKTWLKRDGWKVEKAAAPHAFVLERVVARKTIAG